MKKTLINGIMAVTLLTTACSSDPITINKGEAFELDGQQITVDYSSAAIMTNDEERRTMIAPEGKLYLSLKINAEDDSYFSSVKSGENEIEEVDYMDAKYFVEQSDNPLDPNKNKLYLVDASNGNYSVEIKSFGGVIGTLPISELKDESSLSISESMKAFVNEFNESTRLSEGIQPYVKDTINAYSIMKEKGMDITADPMVKGLEIDYILPGGNGFECSTSEFGPDKILVTWENDKIVEVIFE